MVAGRLAGQPGVSEGLLLGVSHNSARSWYCRGTHFAGPAILRPGAKKLKDEVLGIVANVTPIPLMEDNIAGVALIDEVLQVLRTERRVAAKQDIGNDTHRPHVNGLAMGLAHHNLGSSIAERACHGREQLILVAEHLCDAKVGQHEI